MATVQAASGTTVAAIRETIVGSHLLEIDRFSATKDLGVGKSIRSSTFSVGGHGWYMECYPCGVDEDSTGWVSLLLCLSVQKEQVEAECCFTLTGNDGADLEDYQYRYKHTYNTETSWRLGLYFMERAELESLLKDDDCFRIRCDVYIVKGFSAVPPPDLKVGGELFAVHRTSTVATIFAENVAGSHVLTIDGYSNAKKAFRPGLCLESIFLVKCSGRAVKVRFELTLLTLAREAESLPLLGDIFHVKCDVTIVNEITPLRPRDLHRNFGDLLESQVGTDVEFEVGGDLFSAHKLVLAARSTAFMTEFFGPAGNRSCTTVTRLHIADMEPRVFKALLHFMYTDTLPKVHQEEDKIMMAQGLLVAADRYAIERLKLICSDMLCNYLKDAHTAVATLELADKHGFSLHEARRRCYLCYILRSTA